MMKHDDVLCDSKINTEKSLLKNQAYAIIKSAIINQKLKADKIYSQEFLSSELGISRTPVREALLQMQNEGMINIFRGRGIQIVSPSKKVVQDLIVLRDAVECKSCEIAATKMDEHILSRLQENFNKQLEMIPDNQIAKFLEYDLEFHMIIAQTTHNDMIVKCLEGINDKLGRSGALYVFPPENIQQIIAEHKEILEALAKKSETQATQAMAKHMQGFFIRVAQCLEKIN